MKIDDVDVSPSESQFPFTFGDSPPRASEPPSYAFGSMGGPIQPPIRLLDTQLVHKTVNGAGNQGPALLSPIPQPGHGYTDAYDIEPQSRNSWSQLLSQMKMQC